MNDYTHYKWIVREKGTNKILRTITAKKGEHIKLAQNEELGEKIGGFRSVNS